MEFERRLSQAFGEPVHVGPMRLTFHRGLSIEARDVSVDPDSSFGEGPIVEIGRVSAAVSVWDYLFHDRSAIENLGLENLRLRLVKREDGAWNWTTLGRPGASAATVSRGADEPFLAILPDVTLPIDSSQITPSHITTENAEVVLVNRTVSPPTETRYDGLALDTNVTSADGSYQLVGRVSDDSAAAGGEPLEANIGFNLTLTPPADVQVWRVRGNVTSGRLATRNVRVDSGSTDVVLDETQVLHLESLSADLYGGTIKGRFALDLSTPNNRFTTTVQAQNLTLGDALAPRPDLTGSLRGQASGTIQATGELGDFNSTLGSLDGNGHIVLDNAQLTSVNVIAEMMKQGGFQQISFDEPGTHADRIEADLDAKGGRYNFKNATISSINGYADVRGDSGWIDLQTPASFHLEGAATLLPPLLDKMREKNSIANVLMQLISARPSLTIPLTLDGPLTKPAVSVHWAAVAGLPFMPR
jgi:hypothetical protein